MTESPRSLVAWTLAMIALAIVLAVAVYLARDAILLIYISIVLAIGFGPLVRAIERQRFVPVGTRRLPRWLAILVVYLAIVGAVVAVGFMVVPPLVDQAQQFWQALPSLIDRGQHWLMTRGWTTHRITLEEAVQSAPGTPTSAVGTVATALGRIGTIVLGFVTILILTFYMLVESEDLFAGFARLFPADRRPSVQRVARHVSDKVSAWLAGQLMLAATIGGSSALGLYFIGVPYFYLLALISAVGEMIPVVGPLLSAIPAIAVALSVSPKTAIYVVLFFVAQQQAENHLLVPKIMQRQVGVSPVIVIVALLVGGSVLGIVGAILAVPTAAIIQVIVQELLEERDRNQEAGANP